MIQPMNLVSFRDRLSCSLRWILIAFSAINFAQFVFGERWDVPGAQQAFQEAKEKHNQLSQTSKPTLSQYLECAQSFRKVYLKNPHFGRSGEAILEEAAVYQEMGDKFGDLEYYKTAAKRLNLLVKEYDGNPNCPEALERLGFIYLKRLNDPIAAQEVYQKLKSEYRNSQAALRANRLAAPPKASEPLPAQKKDETPKPPESSQRAISVIQNVRFWTASDYTRVSIDMDLEASFEKFQISEPERIYLDISNSGVSKEFQDRTITVGDSVLRQIRIAQNRTGLVRVVLDCSAVVDYSANELHNPYRIVLDMRPRLSGSRASKQSTEKKIEASTVEAQKPALTEDLPPAPRPAEAALKKSATAPTEKVAEAIRSSEKASAKPQNARFEKAVQPPSAIVPDTISPPKPALPTSQGDRTLTRILGLKVGRIVIDPGHGGHDQGTIGPGGLLEKDLVLSLALGLEKMLREKLGAEVFLTRADDTFIPLEERTAIANKNHADLFISIHANSSKIKSISGVETYYLNFAQTDAEREIAARENATNVSNVADLEDLIKKIAQADKSAESRELAAALQTKPYSGAKKLFPDAHNRGVRSAPFIVLIGANMPSVLSEVAFISNPRDERLLKKDLNQEYLIKALYSGIETYIKTLGSDANLNKQVQKQ
jgi:N-acetylmuramoyl-L-alanine amidase